MVVCTTCNNGNYQSSKPFPKELDDVFYDDQPMIKYRAEDFSKKPRRRSGSSGIGSNASSSRPSSSSDSDNGYCSENFTGRGSKPSQDDDLASSESGCSCSDDLDSPPIRRFDMQTYSSQELKRFCEESFQRFDQDRLYNQLSGFFEVFQDTYQKLYVPEEETKEKIVTTIPKNPTVQYLPCLKEEWSNDWDAISTEIYQKVQEQADNVRKYPFHVVKGRQATGKAKNEAPLPDFLAKSVKSVESDSKPKSGLYKHLLCKDFFLKNACLNMSKCRYAHSDDELRQNSQIISFLNNPKSKTKPCPRIQRQGFCLYGKNCGFIH